MGRGVERLTPNGVVANGVEYEVDCIVFATGFEVGTGYTRRAGYDIVGRAGLTLSQKWEDGPRTLHGMQTTDFPNCFFLGFTHTAVTVNVPQALNEQATHISYLISQVRDQGGTTIEATSEGEEMWVEEIADKSQLGERFRAECTPGYYNNEGKVGNPDGFFTTSYGAGPLRFHRILADWREEGRLDGAAIS